MPICLFIVAGILVSYKQNQHTSLPVTEKVSRPYPSNVPPWEQANWPWRQSNVKPRKIKCLPADQRPQNVGFRRGMPFAYLPTSTLPILPMPKDLALSVVAVCRCLPRPAGVCHYLPLYVVVSRYLPLYVAVCRCLVVVCLLLVAAVLSLPTVKDP